MERWGFDRRDGAGRPAAGVCATTALLAIAAIMASSAASTNARADVVATFTVQDISGGCYVDDQETPFQGDPDRQFRMAIFDDDAAAPAACPVGCAGDGDPSTIDGTSLDYCVTDTGCNTLTFSTQQITKVVADQTAPSFYFGLFDDDGTDRTDSLGDHWITATGSESGTILNNNASPYDPESATPASVMCGFPTEGTGDASNFEFTYWISFQDTTPPVEATNLVASDDAIDGVTWDNDSSIRFVWTPANDPNSGIGDQIIRIAQNFPDNIVYSSTLDPATTSLSFCQTCPRQLTIVNGNTYFARIQSRNGGLPEVDNATWVTSSTTSVTVDQSPPWSYIHAPAQGAWLGAGATMLTLSDQDFGAGLDYCRIEIRSNGIPTVPSEIRLCDVDLPITIGTASDCRDEGLNTCEVSVWSFDLARSWSGRHTRTYSVDTVGDPITVLQAFTHEGGSPIPPGVPQPDRTPYLTWAAPSSSSPIVGYSWALDASADCVVDGVTTSFTPAEPLPVGASTFEVRAIDEAGNCGPAASFTIVTEASAPVPLFGHLALGIVGAAFAAAGWRRLRSR